MTLVRETNAWCFQYDLNTIPIFVGEDECTLFAVIDPEADMDTRNAFLKMYNDPNYKQINPSCCGVIAKNIQGDPNITQDIININQSEEQS